MGIRGNCSGSGDRCTHSIDRIAVVLTNMVGSAKPDRVLCRNCVTYPPNPGQTPSFTRTRRRISLLREVIDREMRWWDLVCVSTRERNRFPSVLLQPLGHLSVFRINDLRAAVNDYRTRRVRTPPETRSPVVSATCGERGRLSTVDCVRPPNLPRSLKSVGDDFLGLRDGHGPRQRHIPLTDISTRDI